MRAMRLAILLERDIACLLDADPTSIEVIGERRVLTYLVEKDNESRSEHAIPIKLTFEKLNGDHRLREAEISRNVSDLLSTFLIVQILRAGCGARSDVMSLMRQRVLVDISRINHQLLPSRDKILALFGQPNGEAKPVGTLSYSYSLRSSTGVRKGARFSAFLQEGGVMQKLEFGTPWKRTSVKDRRS